MSFLKIVKPTYLLPTLMIFVSLISAKPCILNSNLTTGYHLPQNFPYLKGFFILLPRSLLLYYNIIGKGLEDAILKQAGLK